MNQKPDEVRHAKGNGHGRRDVSGTGGGQRERPDVSLSAMPTGAMNEGEIGPQRSSSGEMPSGDMNASMSRRGTGEGGGERMGVPVKGGPGLGEMPGGAIAQQGGVEPGEMPAAPTGKGISGVGTEETGETGQVITVSGTWKMSFTIDSRA